MKVWELEEGKEYVVNGLHSTMACEKYRIKNGVLESFNYGEWGGSSWDNRIDILKELDLIEYTTPPTDWSKVEIDTKILVRNNEEDEWVKRHFAKYENDRVYIWSNGYTSFTADVTHGMMAWNYAKLYEEKG